MAENLPENKLESDIKLRVSGELDSAEVSLTKPETSAEGSSGCSSGDALQDRRNSEPLLASQPHDAARILKELPTDEFLSLLEQSSPEQLQAFLQALAPNQRPFFQALPKLFGTLLSVPEEPRGSFSIIAWWESRRILFNLIVGLCGLPTLLLLLLSGLAHEGIIVSGTIEYALLANICYTAGWMAELIARAWWQERAKHLGPILFSLGFAFSVLLTVTAGFVVLLLFLLLSLAR